MVSSVGGTGFRVLPWWTEWGHGPVISGHRASSFTPGPLACLQATPDCSEPLVGVKALQLGSLPPQLKHTVYKPMLGGRRRVTFRSTDYFLRSCGFGNDNSHVVSGEGT